MEDFVATEYRSSSEHKKESFAEPFGEAFLYNSERSLLNLSKKGGQLFDNLTKSI